MNPKTAFETYLSGQSEEAWSAALATLLRSIHEVDRNATQIWFAFYPLSLFRALEAAQDRLVEKTFFQNLGIATPSFALANGASYLVVGRPITRASDPLAALRGMVAEAGRA